MGVEAGRSAELLMDICSEELYIAKCLLRGEFSNPLLLRVAGCTEPYFSNVQSRVMEYIEQATAGGSNPSTCNGKFAGNLLWEAITRGGHCTQHTSLDAKT
eukprot:6485806-Amphidinium_carterae.2